MGEDKRMGWESREIAEFLASQEPFLAALFDRAPDNLALYDADLRIVRVSERLARMMGRVPAQIVGLRNADVMPPEFAAFQDQSLKRVLETGEILELGDVHAPDPVRGRQAIDLVPCRLGPECVLVLVRIRDVTVDQETRDVLRALSAAFSGKTGAAFFEAVVETVCDVLGLEMALVGGVVGTPPREVTTVAFWADGAVRSNFTYALDGTPCDEVIAGRACVHRDGVAAKFPRDAMLAEAGIAAYVGAPLVDSRGRSIGILVGLSRHPFPEGEHHLQLLRIFVDRVSVELEREHALRALEESEERLRTILESTGDAVFVHDAEGRFVEVNRRACDSLGYTRDELLGLSVSHIEVMESHLAEQSEVWRRALAGESQSIRGMHRRKDGTVFPVEVKLSPMNLGGRRLFVGAARDISERLAAEEALVRSERLAVAGTLAAGVAHEFNNILSIIRTHGETARLHEGIPVEVAGALDVIAAQIRRGAAIVDAMRALTKPTPPRREVVPVLELVEEAVRLLKLQSLAASGISVTTEIPGELCIRADRGQMLQVIHNLLINALDALADRGEGRIRLSAAGRRGQVRIVVEDDGIGMSEETSRRVFLPFFTTKHSSQSNGRSGTGLGLSICNAIVQAHDGRLSCRSVSGKGTVFTLEIAGAAPETGSAACEDGGGEALRGAPERLARSGAEASRARRQRRILVVDDEAALCEGLVALLRRRGYEAEAALGPAAAERRVGSYSPDLLLVDQTMPGECGSALARRLRADRPNLAVILMTGLLERGAVESEARVHGFAQVIGKPFETGELYAAVARALGED